VVAIFNGNVKERNMCTVLAYAQFSFGVGVVAIYNGNVKKGKSGVFQPNNPATYLCWNAIVVEIFVEIFIEWLNFNVLLAIIDSIKLN
jgi:hypothetical protein